MLPSADKLPEIDINLKLKSDRAHQYVGFDVGNNLRRNAGYLCVFDGHLLREPPLILMSLGISTVITSIHSESTFSLKTSQELRFANAVQ